MAGTIVSILPLTHYNFSYLAKHQKEKVRLAAAIDVGQYKSAQLIVRLHENRIASGCTGTMTIKLFPSTPSPEDPRAFVEDTTADATVTINDLATDAAPKYFNAGAATINGPNYTIELEATQTGTNGAALAAQISVELVLRED